MTRLIAAVAAFALCFNVAAQTKPFEPQVGQAGKDVIWVPTPDDVVVDAYCGVGTFTALMGPFVKSAVGIEESPAAIQDADANARDLPNVRFLAGKTEDILPKLTERPTKALLDPARVGCERPVLDALIEARLERIVYVSCDPATLARDLEALAAHGYALDAAEAPAVSLDDQHERVVLVLAERALRTGELGHETDLDGLLCKRAGSGEHRRADDHERSHVPAAGLPRLLDESSRLRGEGEGPDAHRAFDVAAEHIAKRLRRYRRRVNEHARDMADERLPPTAETARQVILARPVEEPEEQEETLVSAHPDDGTVADGLTAKEHDDLLHKQDGESTIIAEIPTEISRLSVSEAVMRLDLGQMRGGSGPVQYPQRQGDPARPPLRPRARAR